MIQRARPVLLVLLYFGTVSAVTGGVLGVVANGAGVPLEYLNGTPFTSYLIPGLILGVAIGGTQGLAAIATQRRHQYSPIAATGAAVNIVIVGQGVIGLTYGCVLAEAGNTVRHLLKEGTGDGVSSVVVNLLDGRSAPPLQATHSYSVTAWAPDTDVMDLVIVSVPGASLPEAMGTLREHGLDDRLLIFGGVWMERTRLDSLLGHSRYLLGYPVAGGRRDDHHVDTVLFDSVILESSVPLTADLHAVAMAAFTGCGLQVEQSKFMLEWLWAHEAINAGIVSAIGAQYRRDADISQMVRQAMADPRTLRRGIRNIRECLGAVRARGVRLRHHLVDVAPFVALPVGIAARLMMIMFRYNVLSRRIMELHHNLDDTLSGMAEVDQTAKHLSVPTPGFAHDFAAAVHGSQAMAPPAEQASVGSRDGAGCRGGMGCSVGTRGRAGGGSPTSDPQSLEVDRDQHGRVGTSVPAGL